MIKTLLAGAFFGSISFLVSYICGMIAVRISTRRFAQNAERIRAECEKEMKEMIPRAHWEGKRGNYTCSRCGSESPEDGYYSSPFCYECGALMSIEQPEGVET